MNSYRCPYLDQLGRELIDTYRQVGADGLFCNAIVGLHHRMTEHRSSCPLCQQAERESLRSITKAAVLDWPKSSGAHS
jgi:hypothetical protein